MERRRTAYCPHCGKELNELMVREIIESADPTEYWAAYYGECGTKGDLTQARKDAARMLRRHGAEDIAIVDYPGDRRYTVTTVGKAYVFSDDEGESWYFDPETGRLTDRCFEY